MAAQTVACKLFNESSEHNLLLEKADLPWGDWSSIGKPPQIIVARSSGSWGAESGGPFSGTEGTVVYKVGATGAKLELYWDDPFSGSNKFTQRLIPPSSSTDPGVPNYLEFDPMRPQHRIKTPTDPVQFEKGGHLSVTYRFGQAEPVEAVAPPSPANPPSPSDTRVASAPSTQTTTVQCPPGFRKVLFFGMSHTSVIAEAQQLKNHVPKANENLTVITDTTHKWVLDDARFEKDTPLLTAAARKKLADLEAAEDLMEFTGPGYGDSPLTVDKALRKYTIRALAAEFVKCDDDFNPGVDCHALRRLCISGHHSRGGWSNGREDLLWGSMNHDGPPLVVLTLFNDGKVHGILAGLANIFPKAFARVEDMCFSACYTAWYTDKGKSQIPPAMFKVFKNLSTLWAYRNSSPAAVNFTPTPPATSSNLAIISWESATRNPDSIDALDKASLGIRKKIGAALADQGQSVVFSHGTMRPAPEPGQPQEPASCASPTPNSSI
ncbi:MAG: aegerolysin family protein [Polyangiaceae bacterium]